MTPGARVAAAIEIIDQIIDGSPAERALTAWARRSRYAGSKDRAAVRDHVFDVLRGKRSLGDGDGRQLMIALVRRDGLDVDALFNGQGHAPQPLTDPERDDPPPAEGAAACDIPEWLWPMWQNGLGEWAIPAAKAMQSRASVFLRVNKRRTDTANAITLLAEDGIEAVAHPHANTGLHVLQNERRVKASRAYVEGLVELQDASSQIAVAKVPMAVGARVLDYCAGGGGKALALADMQDCSVFAHDINPARMKDLPVRADRAGVSVTCLDTTALSSAGPFDVVFCDAPCSGSGTWRRTPDAKWRLSADTLRNYAIIQQDVLAAGAGLVKPGGVLAYATCSVLDIENDSVTSAFLANHPDWQMTDRMQLYPSEDWDGFYLCCLVQK